MESPVQASFIPHDAANPTANPATRRSGGLGELMLLMSIVLLVASVGLAGGVYLYVQYLETTSTSKVAQLERAKAAFDPSLIQQLTRLDDRMHAADTVLSTHIAPTIFFQALQQATLSTISFQSLSFELTDQQHLGMTMSGIAQSVNSIALQAEVFSKNGVIANPIFSGISRQMDGVHFNLVALINPSAINYVQSLSAAAPIEMAPAQAPTQDASPFAPLPAQGANQ